MSKQPSTSAARVRYIVLDITKSVAFYRDFLGFAVVMDRAPGFALLSKGNLELYLNTPGAGGAGQTLSTGEKPQPGGWNRIQLLVQDLDAEIKSLEQKGATFKAAVVEGVAGKQILLVDPSGNLVELFQPYEQTRS